MVVMVMVMVAKRQTADGNGDGGDGNCDQAWLTSKDCLPALPSAQLAVCPREHSHDREPYLTLCANCTTPSGA